ncbi:DUF7848 domain-containing protein [Streptomyces sp. NPDC055089]
MPWQWGRKTARTWPQSSETAAPWRSRTWAEPSDGSSDGNPTVAGRGAGPVRDAVHRGTRRSHRPANNFDEPQDWVLRHCDQNPPHQTYQEIITCPWQTRRRT